MEELRAKKTKGPGGLREEAKKYGVKYASKMKKEELISLINSSKYVNNGEEVFFDRDELVDIAKQAGITGISSKSKQRLISEIRFKRNDTADRELREPSFYEDKSDEELVKDLFMQTNKSFDVYSLKNGFGYVFCTQSRKVVNMEKCFVRIRAGSEVKLLDTDVCGERRVNENGEAYIVRNGEAMYMPKDSPHLRRIRTVSEVFEIDKIPVLLLDDRENWNKESLYSLILLLGCSMSKIDKRADNHKLLSFIITLEANTFIASVYGEKNVTHLDLRKRFYKARRDLGEQAFFINASRAKNSEKGKRLAKTNGRKRHDF